MNVKPVDVSRFVSRLDLPGVGEVSRADIIAAFEAALTHHACTDVRGAVAFACGYLAESDPEVSDLLQRLMDKEQSRFDALLNKQAVG